MRSDQESLLGQAHASDVFSKLRDDAASIICLRDKDTCFSRQSVVSITESKLSVQFDFDHELMSSWVYRSTFASLIREKLQARKGESIQFADTISVINLGSYEEDTQSILTIRAKPTSEREKDEIDGQPGNEDGAYDSKLVIGGVAVTVDDNDGRSHNSSEHEESDWVRSTLLALQIQNNISDQVIENNRSLIAQDTSNSSQKLKKVSFYPRVQYFEVWSNQSYNRAGPPCTANLLNLTLAERLKEELNKYKKMVSISSV